MKEEDLNVFIEGATHYFMQTGCSAPRVGTPYLVDGRTASGRGYTGVIGVTGQRRGSVFFTAPKTLLRKLLACLGEDDMTHENMCDVVGEVANTISGNARKVFGRQFMISAPVVVAGRTEKLDLPAKNRSYVVPISWQGQEAGLVLSFD